MMSLGSASQLQAQQHAHLLQQQQHAHQQAQHQQDTRLIVAEYAERLRRTEIRHTKQETRMVQEARQAVEASQHQCRLAYDELKAELQREQKLRWDAQAHVEQLELGLAKAQKQLQRSQVSHSYD